MQIPSSSTLPSDISWWWICDVNYCRSDYSITFEDHLCLTKCSSCYGWWPCTGLRWLSWTGKVVSGVKGCGSRWSYKIQKTIFLTISDTILFICISIANIVAANPLYHIDFGNLHNNETIVAGSKCKTYCFSTKLILLSFMMILLELKYMAERVYLPQIWFA